VRRRALALCLAALYLAMGLVWVFTNPPGAAPDEPEHYKRAVSLADGQIRGAPSGDVFSSVDSPGQTAWLTLNTRVVAIPPQLSPPTTWGCDRHLPDLTARCLHDRTGYPPSVDLAGDRELNYTGTYQPFIYFLPGLVMRLAPDPLTALRLGRIVTLLICVSLIGLGAMLLWSAESPGLSMVGLVLAVTPLVLFLFSSLSPSGPEVAGAICLAASMLHLSRGEPVSPLVWWGIGAGGVVLALARSLGPVWLLVDTAFIVVLFGARRVWAVLRSHPRASLALGIAIGLAVALNLAWELTVPPHASISIREIFSNVRPAWGDARRSVNEGIGNFGWLDTKMPLPAYDLWKLLLLGLFSVALWAGSWRQRFALLVSVAASVAGALVLSAAVFRPTSFGIQARYLFPFALAPVMMAGEIVWQRRKRLASFAARLPPLILGAAALDLLLGWLSNERRYAVGGRGPWLFLRSSEWQPPLGWWPWVAVMASVVVGLLVAVVRTSRPVRDRAAGAVPVSRPA
jgi:predicted membrane protein DUF2142